MAFVKLHQNCDDCGSSDALSYNEDGSSYCFACAKFTPSPDSVGGPVRDINDYRIPTPKSSDVVLRGEYTSFSDRGIAKHTMKKYSTTVRNGEVNFGYHTPDGELTAIKHRKPDKTFKIEGDWTRAALFGLGHGRHAGPRPGG